MTTPQNDAERDFIAAWQAAQGHPVDDLDGAERLRQAATGNEMKIPVPGTGDSAEADGIAFIQGLTSRRPPTMNPELLKQEVIDNQDYPEGHPVRAWLDAIGYPRPSWMPQLRNNREIPAVSRSELPEVEVVGAGAVKMAIAHKKGYQGQAAFEYAQRLTGTTTDTILFDAAVLDRMIRENGGQMPPMA